MDDDTAIVADLFDHLVRAQILLWNAVDGRLRADHDLPLSWFEPMRVIASRDHARVRDIATTLLVTDGGASKLVDRIAAAGFLHRHRHPDDGRAAWLELSDSGRQVLAAAEASFHDELSRRLGSTMSADHIRELAGSLAILRTVAASAGSASADR
ncbi:MarR family winged helix-turn-helix transcriptional regulator [uncultured Williamsia sp.]|uniref:MarR family winged helix-turn-helix transcriptional regulator n=1 Tax=uncultured Williamsia sp. TaxID=259311 RepID=UPI00260E0092|nr:MarR family winged helix-turn-helix transcriptional regulator [uncultured Williamsia sp.]